jgi:hypothetical protein
MNPVRVLKILTGFFHKVLSIPSVNFILNGIDKTALGYRIRSKKASLAEALAKAQRVLLYK